MPNKKALIITYYEAPNYGAFLQAYSTQKFLRQNGVEAKICRHIANKPNILNWLLDKRVPAESLAYRDALKEKIDQAQKYLQYDEDGENDFNLAIIGSDEVWNIKSDGDPSSDFFSALQKSKKDNCLCGLCRQM